MSQATFYRIANWKMHFENSRTRTMQKMQWVPVPNRHDGEGYLTLLKRPNGTAHYGAWHLILQVASKCPIRGVLLREDGKPHDAKSIAMKTSSESQLIDDTFPILTEVGWLERVTAEVEILSKDGNTSLSVTYKDAYQEGVNEGREGREGEGREGKELNGIEGMKEGAPDRSAFRAALTVSGLRMREQAIDLLSAADRKAWDYPKRCRMICATQKVLKFKGMDESKRVATIIQSTENDDFGEKELQDADRLIKQYSESKNSNGSNGNH